MFSSERNCMVLEGDAQRGPKEAAHFHDRKIQLRPAPSRKAPDRSLFTELDSKGRLRRRSSHPIARISVHVTWSPDRNYHLGNSCRCRRFGYSKNL